MKKLSLFLFAILILGCDTETPIIEETVVEEPEPVIEERLPTVASGEHFRLDIEEPVLVGANVLDGDVDVDPERLNADGIRFDFNNRLTLHKMTILAEGKPLHWVGTNLSDHVTTTLFASPFFSHELQFDTEYVIKIFIQDLPCRSFHFEVRFRTKPKP